METKRIFLAGFLIILVWVFWQAFFFPQPSEVASKTIKEPPSPSFDQEEPLASFSSPENDRGVSGEDVFIFTIQNEKFKTRLSNQRLGTFLTYSLIDEAPQYRGSFVAKDVGGKNNYVFDKEAPVEFLFGKSDGFNSCNPCLEGFYPKNVSVYINGEKYAQDVFVVLQETVVRFVDEDSGAFHELTFFPDSYTVEHEYVLADNLNITLLWKNGIRPSEKYYWLDDQMSYAMYVGEDEDDYDWLTGPLESSPLQYNKNLNWVGLRNKFFVSTIKPYTESSKLIVSPNSGDEFARRFDRSEPNILKPPSVYDVAIDFDRTKNLRFDTFMAPLDYSVVSDSNIENLDWIMTLGSSIFRPISKFIIQLIQSINYYIPFGGYALTLILFAFLVRLVAGPLTKMSLDSTRKMQELQPIIKEIQNKYKSDPKKMQMKIMQTYKEHKANPLSGCLLMFLQWPIMIPPFIIFRSTVELRGESFLWVPDLALPDYLITLPFKIPIIGFGNETGIGLLPILMGITLFLTMRQTSVGLEGQNKVMMYSMNGMFVLLFNSFPAGLNLYYVVYNLLNYLQQRNRTKK